VVQRIKGSGDDKIRIRIRKRRRDPSVWLGYVDQWFSGSVVQRIKGSGDDRIRIRIRDWWEAFKSLGLEREGGTLLFG
jgi:hypothetical protein